MHSSIVNTVRICPATKATVNRDHASKASAVRTVSHARLNSTACVRLQQKHVLAGAALSLESRSRRAVCAAAPLSIRMEEGEEEMMIEEEALEKMEKSIGSVESNLNTIRTGRANASLLDRLEVEYYGAPCSLKSLATVTTPDAQTIAVQPFDKSSIGDIERAIMTSDIGINPNNDGSTIRLIIPALTQERRKELVKTVSKLGEDGKVALRNIRRDATKQLQKLEKDGNSSKDMIADYCKSIDDMTSKYVGKIEDMVKSKEAEVMKV